MTINKYFVFVPQDVEQEIENQLVSDQEAQRQALVKQAQQEGGKEEGLRIHHTHRRKGSGFRNGEEENPVGGVAYE